MTDATGIYFMGEVIADLRADPNDARILKAALGGSSYFGCIGAANAIKAKSLGHVNSFFLGNISNDHFGRLMSGDMEKAGVKTTYARRTDHISMLALVEVREGRNSFEFYGRQKPNTVEALQLADLPQDYNEDHRLYCFGSVITNVSPARETLEQYARLQADQDHVIYFDPNTRPSLVADRDAYIKRLVDYAGYMSIMRASEEDMEWMFPGQNPAEAAQLFLNEGTEAFIVTHGGKGCTMLACGQSTYLPTQDLGPIAHTVGAGDNFNAGVLVSLASRGLTKRQDLKGLKTLEAWVDIANDANETALRHLKSINQ
jgi:fructokinase